jgi:spore maturation protein CgeB
MKVLAVNNFWQGGWMDHVAHGLETTGIELFQIRFKEQRSILKTFKLNNIIQINEFLENKSLEFFNSEVISLFDKVKPDIFLTMNQSRIFPETVKHIKQNNCITVCFVTDHPFDSHRYTYFPVSLKYFNKLLISDGIWIQNIRNVAPESEIIKIPSGGGYNPDIFYPVDESQISDEERKILSCDISFTGESYGILAEGAYRAGILDQLESFNVKIWGDPGWMKRFPWHSNLKRFYKGGRLSYDLLRKLYHLSTININMPSPQIFTGFQPRVFEIAACKGFQITDWREELDRYFNKDELVSFNNIPDLLEKVNFFLKNPEKRASYIEKAYYKVRNNYTWENQLKTLIPQILR